MQSDNRIEFPNAVIENLAEGTSIKLHQILFYNPTANGLAERTVCRAKLALHKMALAATTEWNFHLPLVQLVMNMCQLRSIGMTPAQAMFSQTAPSALTFMSQPMQLTDKLSVVMLSDFHNKIVHPTVACHLSELQACMKKSLDANCPWAEFKVSHIVLAHDPVRKSHSSPKWLGLFEVIVISAGGAVTLTAHGGDNALTPPERKFAPH
ncbi:hypothetical protein H4S08_004443 [Coemansia sp. RSA 1365]|nr:hypothetical protein H4S08_004443 [Coemansia sp. RSA 1365]